MSREAMKLALEYVEYVPDDRYAVEHIDRDKLVTALREALAEQPAQQEPVAHCEAGPHYCQQCHMEDRSLALAAAVGYVQRNTPHLVSTEICKALSHIVDVNKMVEALREIGDFAHDKSTGPVVPDALWEIRSMAYAAMEDALSPPPQRTWVGLSPADRGKCLSAGDAHGWIGVMEATEARLKELNT